MNVNKKNFLILLLMILLPISVKGFSITIDWEHPVYAGYGTRKSWAEPKRDSSGNLYLCTQFELDAGTECSNTETNLSDEVHAGIGVIVSQNINYVCKEKLLTKFLYHKLSTSGRTNVDIDTSEGTGSNGKPAARWANSCSNAQTIYNNANDAYDNVVDFKKQRISYSKTKLDFIYNSSTNKYEAEVTVDDNVSDYWCSADNGAEVSSSYYVTKVSISPENVVNDTTLTCWPRMYIDKTKYYTCGSNKQAMVPDSTTRTAIWASGASIKGKAKTFKINKVNSNGDKIISDTASFGIYTDSNCTNALYSSLTTQEGTGVIDIKLPPGTYYIKELESPDIDFNNYIRDDSCRTIVVGTDENSNYVNIVNKTECEVDFEDDSSIKNRLYLYKKYDSKYKNLLNFDGVKSAAEACSTYEPNYVPTESCLQTKQVDNTTQNKFNKGNLSDYNETILSSIDSSVSYCLTNFEIIKKQDIKDNVHAGQLVIDVTEGSPIVTGKVTKTCYIHKDDASNYGVLHQNNKLTITSSGNYITYNDYVDSLEINNVIYKPENKILEFKDLVATRTSQNDEFFKLEESVEVDYIAKPVYAYKISGKLPEIELECINDNGKINSKCSIIGYGIISEFQDGKTGSNSFYFKINKGSSNVFKFNTNNVCEYIVNPEIIKYKEDSNGKLELEFRTVDKNKPFDRKTNSNWCGEGTDPCNSNNTTVQSVIKERNDSYNRTGGGALYTNQTDGTKRIILTPDIIQKVKDYNKRVGSYNDYSNYTSIVGGKEITSTAFLDELEIRKVS